MSLPVDMTRFRAMLAADLAEGWDLDTTDAGTWTVCEGGCERALPTEEAEHAQCGSLLVYCGDCLADHARACLVCGAE